MVILHAGWVPSSDDLKHICDPLDAAQFCLFLWGEWGDRDETKTGEVSSAPTGTEVPLHPYLLSIDAIQTALSVRGLNEKLFSTYYVSLPTANGRPVSEPMALLSAQHPVDTDELWKLQWESAAASESKSGLTVQVETPRERWWQVKGLLTQGCKALDLLSWIGRLPSIRSGDVLLGSDLVFWMEAGQLALKILRKSKFIPNAAVAAGTSHQLRTFWSVLYGDPDIEDQTKILAKRMPPSCLQYAYPTAPDGQLGNGPRFTGPEELLRCFLDGIVQQSVLAWLREAAEENPHVFRVGQKLAQSKIADHWLRCLSGQQTDRSDEYYESRWFANTIYHWRRSLLDDEPWELCLVAEPTEISPDTAPSVAAVKWWRLRLYLDGVNRDSALIPADWIFCSKLKLKETERRLLPSDPVGKLRAAIARAVAVLPALSSLLEQDEPTELVVSSEQFYRLLQTPEEEMQAAGLHVTLPKGLAQVRQAKVRGTAQPAGSSMLGLDTLLSFDWTVAIEDVEIDRDEFERLVKLRLPVIRIYDRYVMLSSSLTRKLLKLWRTEKDGHLTVGEMLRLQAENGEDEELSFDLQSKGWLSQLLAEPERDRKFQLLPQPKGFQGSMRPYQLRGYSWLKLLSDSGIGACLADDMGLGKTIQVIALLLAKSSESTEQMPSLVVCPTSVIGNWRRELQRFAPTLRVAVYHGPNRAEGSDWKERIVQSDVVLTTYGIVARDRDELAAIQWQGVVLDEAQNIKNPRTQQSRAVRALPAAYKVALTGTPIENSLVELWSLMQFLNPGFLGSLAEFRRTYSNPIERKQDRAAQEKLRRLIRPFVLRRVKTDPAIAAELPQKLEMKVYCSLTLEQAQLYQGVVDQLEAKLAAEDLSLMERRGLILATLARLKQIVDHPSLFLNDRRLSGRRSGKLERLQEMLTEIIAEGEKSLIFTQFAQMGRYLQKHLQTWLGKEILFLHGAVPQKQRMQLVDRFQTSSVDECPVFVLSLKAGGTGLNLTAATHVFHYDRWWNPAVENQATDRAFRIGQTRVVQVHKFICGGTVEDRIDQLIDSKRELADNIVGAGEAWLTELSNAELRELIRLQTADILD